MAYEVTLEKKITGAISGFKNNTKTAKEVNDLIAQLRKINPGLADDHNKKFVEAAREKAAKK